MRQLLQNMRNGAVTLNEVPCPSDRAGRLLIRTRATLISSGTERMLLDFARAGFLQKARQQPEKVRMVLDKIKTDGLVPTIETVRNKLEQPMEMGYCNVGEVLSVGKGILGYQLGDRVASNGKHAEVVSVPVNLCAKVPDSVSNDEAAFTVLGSIALQGIRLAQPTLGEIVVVTGLGLIGLLTVQILKANGCRVVGIDLDESKLALAEQFGAETINLKAGEDPVATSLTLSKGQGVDAVIVTAATRSNEPIHQAALMCRKKGRIVLVGVTGLELSRDDFYEKELSFQVSCSYGPGRYDPNYEDKGNDYPIGYVRWTEQRNMEAVLQLMADRRLNVNPLISHRFSIDEAPAAYELVSSKTPSLGILLKYHDQNELTDEKIRETKVRVSDTAVTSKAAKATVGFIGAGNYATSILIPAFKNSGARMKIVSTAQGLSGVLAAKKYGIQEATTNTNQLFEDPDINTIVIATRHNTHAGFVIKALESGKNVFVEKPLCLNLEELAQIQESYNNNIKKGQPRFIMVGYNRRFSPHIQKIKELLGGAPNPKAFIMTVNAGPIPADHWTQDPSIGGGRIIGEGCHFIDLLRFLSGNPISEWRASAMKAVTRDTVTIELRFADGSIGSVHYFANGSKKFPKERLEVFSDGRVIQMDNFRKMTGFGWSGFNKMNLWRQDKGQTFCVGSFVKAIETGGTAPISFEEIIEGTTISILAQKQDFEQ